MTSRNEILELLANGKITADEAAQLLNQPAAPVVEETAVPDVKLLKEEEAMQRHNGGKKPGWLHVRVRDLESGRNKVTVNIPLGMVKFGMKIGGRFSPELNGLDWNELESMMNGMESGLLVDVQDEEGGEHVQVFVD
ncbi:MAG: hypothetical protein BroJett015_22990 [Chloroflexota bacterium]|nr:hypothetical protein [Ardenticatenaceae bacterium]GIK56636.1 MAG: hypothetical protein BroJett015_22990 [Chloroflexota bacterium]